MNTGNTKKDKLKVWLIAEGEPLPVDGNQRLMRVGMLASYLAEKNMEITWWSSTFVHGRKEYFCKTNQKIYMKENEELYLLHSPVAYKKNVSLKRILYHKKLAEVFRKCSQKESKPDVIICSYPTVQFAQEAIRYGKRNGVPVVLDVRDLWPDIFARAFPAKLEKLAKICLLPLKWQTKRVFQKADVITGITPHSLKWGLAKAGREKGQLDQFIYIGYDSSKSNFEQKELDWWNSQGISAETWNVCFVSTLSSKGLDLATCIAAVDRLSEKYPQLRLVICGDGDGMEKYKKEANGNPRIVFAGWCDNEQIQSLLSMGNAGLYSLRNLEDFKDTLSNKAIAYMAAGLPLLSSLEGFSRDYIIKYHLGCVYQEGDVESCMEQLEYMILEPSLKEMGMNARKRFDTDFESDKVNSHFETLIMALVKESA